MIFYAKSAAQMLANASYLESHYQNVLIHLLQEEKIIVSRELHINYLLPDGFCFGYGRIDLYIETIDTIYILELKINCVGSKVQAAKNQLKRYMIHIPNPHKKQVKGCLINFLGNGRHVFNTITLATQKPA